MTDERTEDGGKWKIEQCSVGPETAKVKLLNSNPNIFYEIIELQKMGAVEVPKLKLLIAPFTLG